MGGRTDLGGGEQRAAPPVLGRLLDAVRVLTGARYVALLSATAAEATGSTAIWAATGSDPDPDPDADGVGVGGSRAEEPVLVSGRVAARLVVAGAPGGDAAALSEVTAALATVVGLALAGEQAVVRSEERLRWLEASAALVEVFAPPLDLAAAFAEVVGMARDLAGAAGVALVRRKGELVQPLAVAGQRWSRFEPLLEATHWFRGRGIGAGPELLRLASSSGKGPALMAVAPMHSEVKGTAALLATFESSPDPEAVGLLCAFAGQAAFAFDRAQAGESVGTVRDLTERERVARDLHDQVMQRLFGIGLQVQVAREDVTDPAVRGRLEEVADELDRTLNVIRSTVSALRRAASEGSSEEP